MTGSPRSLATLTGRELAVLGLIAQGRSNAEIGTGSSPGGYPATDRPRAEPILAVGVVLEVILVFIRGLPEGPGLADLGHDLARP